MPNMFDSLPTPDDIEKAKGTQPDPAPTPTAKKKRGRPATGKRSDEAWISRAFYIEESTDIDLEAELTQLRREGVKMDKSELVNSCLVAWLKWRQGENPSKSLGSISARRKDKGAANK